MTESVHVEPAPEHRRDFARWSLAQMPGGHPMASGTAWELPATAFAAVPLELLEGAYIDGRIFRPALAGFEPHGNGYRPTEPAPLVDRLPQAPMRTTEETARRRRGRRTAADKAEEVSK